MIDLGQTYPAILTVTDDDGNPANPDTATLAITLPDGTVVHPTVTLPPVVKGTVRDDYPTVQAGLHKAAWQTTNPAVAAVDYFSVREFISIISLAEAISHLNITRTTTALIAELRRFMMAATELVESKVGTIVRRQFTERVDEGPDALLVSCKPLLSVVSVASTWPGGPVWDAAVLGGSDLEAGIIRQQPPYFHFYQGPWDVTVVAGRAVVAERWDHAAKEQLRHLWSTQRGAQAPAVLQGEEVFTSSTGWSFSVPRRVLELLEQDMVPSS